MIEIKQFNDRVSGRKHLCYVKEVGINHVARIKVIGVNRIIDVGLDTLSYVRTTENILISLGWKYSDISLEYSYMNKITFLNKSNYGLYALDKKNVNQTPVFIGNLDALFKFMKKFKLNTLELEKIINS